MDGACGGSRSVDEKSPINQRILLIRGKNGRVFLFPQNDNVETDLPQGIGCGEQKIYILAKVYYWTKQEGR